MTDIAAIDLAERTGEPVTLQFIGRPGAVTVTPDGGRSVCRPEGFGAVGDGVTDDTAAFQAAINAAKQIDDPGHGRS